jgi:Ca-activated chloride channel family protein
MLLLAPLPWLVRRFTPPVVHREAALRAPFFETWRELGRGQGEQRGSGDLLPQLMLWLIWLSLLLSVARPVWVGEPVELPDSGRDLMLAVDISQSMLTEDMQIERSLVNRIDAVRQIGADFISRRSGDRLGLILFGSNAYLQSPLSFDIATVKRFLLEARVGFAGNATALGDAIGLAVKRLKERPAESRVLILLTDGRDTASSVPPQDAARLAAELGVRVHTIGIGADEMTLPGLFGSGFGSRRVNPSAELDEAGLQEIAQLTGGRYFRARNPRELADIYRVLDELEPVEQEAATYRPRQALGHLPLLAALLLSFALSLGHCWRARVPRAARGGQPAEGRP